MLTGFANGVSPQPSILTQYRIKTSLRQSRTSLTDATNDAPPSLRPRSPHTYLGLVEHGEKLAAATARVLATKGVAPAQQYKQCHATRPDVLCARVVLGSSNVGAGRVNVDVRRAVLGRPELCDQDGLEALFLVTRSCKAKIIIFSVRYLSSMMLSGLMSRCDADLSWM